MARVPKEFSDFWTPIDSCFRRGHVASCKADKYNDEHEKGKLYRIEMKPNLAPLLYFERDVFGKQEIYLGSAGSAQAHFKAGEIVDGGVHLSSFLVSDLSHMADMSLGKTADAKIDRNRNFFVFSRQAAYQNITADHEKIKASLDELEIANIEMTDLHFTSERLGRMIGIYNEKVRATGLELDIIDPLTPMLTYAADPRGEDILNAMIENAVSRRHRMLDEAATLRV